MLLDPLVLHQLALQPICDAQERAGTSMFEDVETPFEHLSRDREVCFLQGLEQLAHMFCRMREIQDTHSVGTMPLGKGLTPVSPIRDCADLLCLPHLAPPHLHLCQL